MKPFGIFIVPLGFFLLLSLNGIAQQLPSYVWVNTIGTTLNDQKILGLTVDASGSTYICGSFEGTVDFDPGAGVTNKTASGIEDCFLAKYNAAGNLVWVNTFGGTGSGRDAVKDVVTDALGNVYVTGLFTGPAVDFGGGGANILASAGTKENIFWAKYASSGVCTFVKKIGVGLTIGDSGNSIVFNSNNIYITGAFSGTSVDFNLGSTPQLQNSNGAADVFIAKYSDTGTFGWVRTIGGVGVDEGKGIDIDPIGNIYVTGSYNGTNIDFNPPTGTTAQKLTSNGGSDIFVVSYNSVPSFRFVTGVGSTGGDSGNAIRYAGNNGGTIYVTGSFNGTADFDPTAGTSNLTSNGGTDAFLASYETASGNLFSRFNVGSSGNDAGMDVFVDRDNGTNLERYVYITGNFSGSNVDFDPGVGSKLKTSNGNADIFLSKYRDNGISFESHWTGTMGNAGDDFGTQLFVSNHLMILGGYFASTSIDFDPTPDGTLTLNNSDASGTTNDMFVGKYINRQVVVNTADAGSGTLRQAITDLNSMGAISGLVPITFDIEGAGPFTINLASSLPTINKSAFIDGYTQTGAIPATSPTTPANLRISINGGGTIPTCLRIQSANTVVRGLHIDGFSTDAINLNTGASDCKIVGNHIGTNIQGLDLGGTMSTGINIASGTNHLIGGNLQSTRNVIATSNPGSAIIISSNSNTILGNYIGYKADNSGYLSVNGTGISFVGPASNNVIGGVSASDFNIIGQCSNTGINFAGASNAQNVLRGNKISCNGAGTNPGIILNGGNGNITSPTITDANTASISGGGTNTGDIVDVYIDNSGCTPSQATSYVGSVTATGSTWILTGLSLNVGDRVTSTITRTQGTSAFSTASSTTALAAEPTVQPTNLVFSNVASSSLTGSFTAATTVPSGYIIIRRLTTSTATVPLDGVSYTAGSTALAGQVVVQVNASTITTFTDSGLSAGTGYSYDIYAFNGTGTTINYLTVNPLTGNATTPAIVIEPTVQPTNLVFSNVASSSLTGSFTAATTVPSGYIIIRRLTTATATAPLDGVSYTAGSAIVAGQIVVQVNASATITFTDSGLSASTGYSYDIYAFNGSGININYLTVNPLTGNATTLPSAVSLPNAPTLLRLDITSGTISVDLSWVDNANNEFNFEIERSANDNLNFRKIATNNADVVKYKDNSVQAGILYYYRVRATNGAGQSAYTEALGAVVGVLVTGIDDNLPKTFKVYPNPSQDIFNIETDAPYDLSKAQLRNAAGQLIENVIIENNYPKSTIDLTNQAKGLYILYIPNGNDKIVLKLIKE